MTCSRIRDQLLAAGAAPPAEAERHLAGCPACARFARRLEEVRRALGEEAGIPPPPGFAGRVVARLPGGPELVGRAALRLLPAAVALALVLSGWCLVATPSPSDLVDAAPTDDPLAWVAEMDEEGP